MEVDLEVDHVGGLEIERNELTLVVLRETGGVEVHHLLDDGNGTGRVDTTSNTKISDGAGSGNIYNRRGSTRRISIDGIDGSLVQVEGDTNGTTESREARRELRADLSAENRVVLDGGKGAGVAEDGVGEVGENEVLEGVELRVRTNGAPAERRARNIEVLETLVGEGVGCTGCLVDGILEGRDEGASEVVVDVGLEGVLRGRLDVVHPASREIRSVELRGRDLVGHGDELTGEGDSRTEELCSETADINSEGHLENDTRGNTIRIDTDRSRHLFVLMPKFFFWQTDENQLGMYQRFIIKQLWDILYEFKNKPEYALFTLEASYVYYRTP